jgi:dCMP deaminase
MSERPTWDQYFMSLATVAAHRSTCERAHVGAIMVRNRQVLATGYNGSVRGLAHCDDIGHLIVDGHCVRTVHAEMNAIAAAAANGTILTGATCYVTHYPCLHCAKLLLNAGIVRVFYHHEYRKDQITQAFFDQSGVQIDGLSLLTH